MTSFIALKYSSGEKSARSGLARPPHDRQDPPTVTPESPSPSPRSSPDAAFETLFATGDDRAVLDSLMDRYGEAVLARCEAALADLGDPTLAGEARHDTFIEAFRSLGPMRSLAEPEKLLMSLADEQCATLRRLEKTRGLPREPLATDEAIGDWKAALHWEVEVLLQERPEGPDRMAQRARRRRGPSIWPALVLGVLSVAFLLYMRRYL